MNHTLNRKAAPEFRAIDNINLVKPEHQKLDNGCNIFSFNSGDQELVRIEWVFSNLRFDPSKPLLNVAVNTMLTEGTSTLSAAQIADQVDFYGAFYCFALFFETKSYEVDTVTQIYAGMVVCITYNKSLRSRSTADRHRHP